MTERHWSLLAKTRGGVVSILRELTLAEAKALYMRLDPMYGVVMTTVLYSDGTEIQSTNEGHRGDNVVDLRAVFGPPTWDHNEVDAWQAESESEWPKQEVKHVDRPPPEWLRR